MSLSFSKEDVHKHLLDLGYSNITNDQLREFMTDLKRLIRYEEKQKRIEAHLQYTSKQSKNDESETTQKSKENKSYQVDGRQRHISADSSYSTATSDGYDSDEAPSRAKITKNRSQSSHRSRSAKEKYSRNESSWTNQEEKNYKKKDLILSKSHNVFESTENSQNGVGDKSKEVTSSYRQDETHKTVEDSTAEEFKIQIRIPQSPPKVSKKSTKENERPTRIKSAPVSRKEVRADFDGGCWEMINQDAIQILPPKPKIPTKPTTSCIKPTFAEKHKKDLRRDPVRLHDYYKKQWEKFKLPGDDSQSTKELRWAVREWMMGRKPPE